MSDIKNGRLDLIRALMRENKIDAYIVVTDDFNGSEYVGTYFKLREYISGFTGSAGTLVILNDKALLWTDGRYFLQAEAQLDGSGIELMKQGEKGVPSIPEYLAEELKSGSVCGFDGRTVTQSFFLKLKRALDVKGIGLCPSFDISDKIWENRPPLSAEPVYELAIKYCGKSREDKLYDLRNELKENGADAIVLSALEDCAYLLNLRGNDVHNTPVFLSFMLVGKDFAKLFVNEKILSAEIKEKLYSCGIEIMPYSDIYESISALPENSTVIIDNDANCRIFDCAKKLHIKSMLSPVAVWRGTKNATEIENFRLAHIYDGVAVFRFNLWLKENAGKGITELSASAKLEEFRREGRDYVGPGFDYIIAYGEHAAIVHYAPTEKTDVPIERRGLCLTDTGGQYLLGTTDITRTVAVGETTKEEKEAYTLVLKSHIHLAQAVFKAGTSGMELDTIAREPLWEKGLDYRHGTGHGIGYLLADHEGPHRIGSGGTYPLCAGMITSNEPGLYITGKFGIRHENLVLIKEKMQTEYGTFLCFEQLTFVPFDTCALDLSIMTDDEISWLNAYHSDVRQKLSPYLDGKELDALIMQTEPIKK